MKSEKLLFERLVTCIGTKIKENKVTFITSLVVGALTFMSAFTSKTANHGDDVYYFFGKGATSDSGRWGLELTSFIFPDFSMPWIYGIISLFIMAVSVCMIINLFEIKNKILQGLTAGLIISFPSLIGTVAYTFTESSFALSFLLAVISAVLIQEKHLWKKAAAVVCLVFSLSIYQSYISVVSGLLLVILVQDILKDRLEFSAILKKGIKFLIFLAVSLGIYFAVTQAVLFFSHSGFGEYAAENLNMQDQSVIHRIVTAYNEFVKIIIKGQHGIFPNKITKLTGIIFILSSVAGGVHGLSSKRENCSIKYCL